MRRAATGRAWVRRLSATLLACCLTLPAHAVGRTLPDVEREVARDHASVSQLSTETFAPMVARGTSLVVFDTRAEAEYRVSRIPGAIWVDPNIDARRFAGEHGAAASGKTVVFYCSVGVRSSNAAERLTPALQERGAAAVHNLTGGIFRWHNEGRPLANESGPTPFVHPYDGTWGKLLLRSDLARYAPG